DDPEKHLIPSMLIHIKPINVDLQASSFFANQLILFIQNQEMALFEKFKSAYGSEVADTTFDELKKVLYTKYFYKNIEQAFQGLVQEYRDIREKRFAILKDIKDRKLGKQDDERLELVQELKNLRGTLKMLGRRQFLEHLTNVGLLPNYAFPETGVTLNGRVVKQKGDGALQTPTPVDIEIVRPARQAIKELIPDNYFYTQGYKLLITGLNVNSWEEESKIMRYCSNCDYVDDQEVTTVMCPKCGDPSFGSTSNKHRFLQLKAVKSFNKEENAALDDGSDERLSEIALRTHHFRFDKSIVQGAYAIRSVPFGIEYVTELEVFEVNSGLRKEVMNRSRKTTINGKEVPVEGYITCRYCGCSSAQMHKQEGNRRVPKVAQDYHYPYCKHKAIVFEPQSSGVFEEVFLYRTMMTEALKILLPVQEFETQSSVAMFMSGIDLGLRKFYKGNPQHIGIHEYREFNGQTGRFDQYVILYDLVPGGTGYLSKLFTPEAFGQVLELAYKGIRDCKCQHHEKDGCYHCIFSYGNRYFQEELSRRKAEDLFYRIIRSNNKWEFMPNGISNITNDGQIEESELEERFIRALRNFVGKKEQQELGWTFEEVNENGIIHYRLLVQTEQSSFEYLIQPQYPLGKSQGVEFATVADFLVRCLAGNVDGKVLTTEEIASILPIAIYLDGYQYHATKENPRFEKDVAKRVSILHSNQFLTWTMTYDDLKLFEAQLSADKETKDVADKFDLQSKLLSGVRNKIQKHPPSGAKGMDTDIFKKQNNLSRLLWLMTSPTEHHIAATIKTYLFCLQSKFGEYLLEEKNVKSAIATNQFFTMFDTKYRDKGGNGFCYLADLPATISDFQVQLALRLKDFSPLFSLFVKQPNEGYDLSSWNVFWQLFNLLQLIVEQPDDLEYLSKEDGFILRSTLKEEEDLTIENEEVFEYFDEEFHPIIEQLLAHNLPFDKDGSFVLLDELENVVAEGILGFSSMKIVFEPFEDYESVFKEMGYKILLPSEFTDELISEIKTSLKNA
ncbi:MAG: DEAD/DEAH box helicase domain-containing protein, partial [Saprospiraceae bacterium]